MSAMEYSVPQQNPALRALFYRMARRNLRRSFRALRIAHDERIRKNDAPLILIANHPSWWEPITGLLIAEALMPHRRHFAPMDARPLRRFPILGRVGMFPIEAGTSRGAVTFLQTAKNILQDQRNVLWLTPQGRFADVRERPAKFAGGLGVLLSQIREATIQPIALEYTFWNERQPEALALVGEPIFQTPSDPKHAEDITRICEEKLTAAQDELATLSILRDPQPFTKILEGRGGTQGLYGAWQRLLGRHRNNEQQQRS